jgi:hypothetical protein
LVPKSSVRIEVDLDGDKRVLEVPTVAALDPVAVRNPSGTNPADTGLAGAGPDDLAIGEADLSVPLVRLAVARSGDKGDHANIGVIARDRRSLPWLRSALTEHAVAAWMAHVLDPVKGKVTRWELPGMGAFNFLLEHALGGGGIASLRIDPQGKAFAQQLLDLPVRVPASLLRQLGD